MLNHRIARWLRLNARGKTTSTYQEHAVTLATDTGTSRSENQDRVAMMRVSPSANAPSFAVVALADGMGGMSDGGECATIGLAVFFNSILKLRNNRPEEMLRLAALEANQAVFSLAQGHGGATLSAVYISPESQATTLNIGDSRIYGWHVNETSAGMGRLTVDDNLAEAVGGTGTELLQFCGMGPGLRPHIGTVPNIAQRLAITSDGVHFIDSNVLHDILINTTQLADVSKQLLTYARWRGSPDNASVALIDLRELKSDLKYEESGIHFTDPFNMLEVAWIRSDAGDPINQPLSPNGAESPPRAEKPAPLANEKKKSKRPVASKKRKDPESNDENQFSIQLDTSSIAEEIGSKESK
jgi:serine/threonine protein phosphatase PrpC